MTKIHSSQIKTVALILWSAVVVILFQWIGAFFDFSEFRIAVRGWLVTFLPMGFVTGFISFLMLEMPAIALLCATEFLAGVTNWKYSRLVGMSLAVSYAVVRVAGYLIVTVITTGPMSWKGFFSGIVGVACLGMLIGLLAWQIGHQIKLIRLGKMGSGENGLPSPHTTNDKTEK